MGLNDIAIEEYLAGELDTAGHDVVIVEKAIGTEIVKFLVIDGEG